MASLMDKMKFYWVEMVDHGNNLNQWKTSEEMSKKDHPTIDYCYLIKPNLCNYKNITIIPKWSCKNVSKNHLVPLQNNTNIL